MAPKESRKIISFNLTAVLVSKLGLAFTMESLFTEMAFAFVGVDDYECLRGSKQTSRNIGILRRIGGEVRGLPAFDMGLRVNAIVDNNLAKE